MNNQSNKLGKELGKKIFPSPFTLSYFIILIALTALTLVTACFSLGLFLLGEFIVGGWLNALAIITLAGEVWLLISLVTSAINAFKIRKFENAKVERVSLFCMHLDVIAKLFLIIGIIVTVMCIIFTCVWTCSAFNILPKFVDWVGSVINGIFGWHLDLEDPTVVTPLMKNIEFANGSPVLAIILAIILPTASGAASYFGYTSIKKTIRAYESMHVDSNTQPSKAPVILLFVFGGFFAALGLFLIVFFFTKIGDPSIFTKLFTTAKETAFDKIYEGIEKFYEGIGKFLYKLVKNRTSGLMYTVSNFILSVLNSIVSFIGGALRTPITFILTILISLLSVLRYIAFIAFDLSLILFGIYLVIKAIMFLTVGNGKVTVAAPVVSTAADEVEDTETVEITEE